MILYRDILKLYLSSELFRNCLSPAQWYHAQAPKAGSAQQAVLSSALPCSTALFSCLKPRQGAEVFSSAGAASHCCLAQAGTDRQRWDALGSHRTNCLSFSSYRVSSRLVSDEEPIMLCRNSPHNSKAY